MSRRSRRAGRAPGPESGARAGGRPPGGERPEGETRPGGQPPADRPGRPPNRISFAAQVGILIAVFAGGVGIAELAGAANLGVAFGVGQIVFAIVLVGLLLRA